MDTLYALEFVRVETTEKGIFAGATLRDWRYEYNFLVEPKGKIYGETALGGWYELSPETSEIICAKIRSFMRNRRMSFN